MIQLIKQLLEKWACKHKWEKVRRNTHKEIVPERIGTIELPHSFFGKENYKTVVNEIWVCKECGKIKKIVL